MNIKKANNVVCNIKGVLIGKDLEWTVFSHCGKDKDTALFAGAQVSGSA